MSRARTKVKSARPKRTPSRPVRSSARATRSLTCLIERDGSWFVSTCPEIDVASQGRSVEDARANLIEAVELFFETASAAEIRSRLSGEFYVTGIEVNVG